LLLVLVSEALLPISDKRNELHDAVVISYVFVQVLDGNKPLLAPPLVIELSGVMIYLSGWLVCVDR
jgi:hypothetical protein